MLRLMNWSNHTKKQLYRFWTNLHQIDLSHFVSISRMFGSMMNVVLQKDRQDFESGITSRAYYLQTERYRLHSYVNTIIFAKRSEPYSQQQLCFTVTGSGSTTAVLLIYRPGSKPVTDVFFEELTSYLEVLAL